MAVAAVIAEYNPMHEGHLYHLDRTRQALGRDCGLVCILSGHVVQRGEFAILSKFARAELALRAGFDLVFELGSPWSCAPAERFARAGVGIAADLGIVTHLSFGAECGDLGRLRVLALKVPVQYPKDVSLARAMPEMFAEDADLFTPNNILALEYLRALADIAPHIEPVAVVRAGSRHDDDVASASALRLRLRQGETPGMPFAQVYARERTAGRAPVLMDDLGRAVLSCLRGMTEAEWAVLPDSGGGLWQRLRGAAAKAGSLDELYALAKTRRYPMARLRRTVMCAFLGITEEMALGRPPLRLLGIGEGGEALLSRVKGRVWHRPVRHEGLRFECGVGAQYALGMPVPAEAGWEYRMGVVKL